MTATRPAVLSRLALAVSLGGLLALPACMINLGAGWDDVTVGGRSVSVKGNVLTVDGTDLNYSRWVDVGVADAGTGELHLATATGPIELAGASAGLVLQARLWSEFEGDGRVELRGGELVTTSDRGGVLLVNELKGTVPPAAPLKLESGTGPVTVSGLLGAPSFDGQTGTGELVLKGCEAREIQVESGTGALRLSDCKAGRIEISSGTGDVLLSGCDTDELKFESGTGDVELASCQVRTLHGETGTGDVLLRQCGLGTVSFESGTGDIVLRGGHCDAITQDLGTGDLKLLEGVTVGAR